MPRSKHRDPTMPGCPTDDGLGWTGKETPAGSSPLSRNIGLLASPLQHVIGKMFRCSFPYPEGLNDVGVTVKGRIILGHGLESLYRQVIPTCPTVAGGP